MSEKRSGTRWHSCLKGSMRCKDGTLVDCLIRDFSAAGARIEITTSAKLAEVIDFFFPLKQVSFQARVRWRAYNDIGLQFEVNETSAPVDPAQALLAQRLLVLEAENAELRLEATQLRRQLEFMCNATVACAA
jgi:hypothetical protein